MRFPEQYIKQGDFELHSGSESNVLYDVNSMLTDRAYLDHVVSLVPGSDHYVGVAMGGALIALAASLRYNSHFSMTRDGKLIGPIPGEDWILIDDVVTTGSSIREALGIIGGIPREIFVAVDRREEKSGLDISSIFDP